jgi:DNA-binding transcriptional regulator YhcF (GntR family)
MSHILTLNTHSKIPLYRQIVDSIEERIRTGSLRHLDALPTQEQIETVYFISPIVVKQAYAILRQRGKVITIQGKGSFINLCPKIEFDYHLFTPRMAKQFENMKVFYQGSIYMNEMHKILFQSSKKEPLFCLKRVSHDQNIPILYQAIYAKPNDGLNFNKIFGDYPMEVFSKMPNTTSTLSYHLAPSRGETSYVLKLDSDEMTHTWKLEIKQANELVVVCFYYAPANQVTLKRED